MVIKNLANETAWCGRPPVTRDIDGIVTHIGRQSFAPGVMVALQVSIERYARESMREVQGSNPCGAKKFMGWALTGKA